MHAKLVDVNVVYFISDRFDYDRTISPAYGRPFASDYGWEVEGIGKIFEIEPDFAIIDNRLDEQEFVTVREYYNRSKKKIIFKLHDPYIEHANSYHYYKFIQGLGEDGRINFLTVYPPSEYLGYMFSKYQTAKFIFAPYLYDRQKEVALQHDRREPKVIISGAADKLIYPLRNRAKRARLLNPLFRYVSAELPHPGYPDIGQGQAHTMVGSRYIDYLARFKFAFCCSSRARLEFLKYREIAYAGCALVGDLPATLLDCPPGAIVGWRRNHVRLAIDLLNETASESMAATFRDFMREHRDVTNWRRRVHSAILTS